MPSQYPYRTTVRNDYLGVSKVIRAMSREELRWLVECQMQKWEEQESRKRVGKEKEQQRSRAKKEVESIKAQSEEDSQTAGQEIDSFRSLLISGLKLQSVPSWEAMLDRTSFPPFTFHEEKPDLAEMRDRLLGTQPSERSVSAPNRQGPSVFEVILPFLRRQRLERESEAERQFEAEKKKARAEYVRSIQQYQSGYVEIKSRYEAAVVAYRETLEQARKVYTTQHATFVTKQQAHNSAILDFRNRYLDGSAEAVERYAQMVLERSDYPEAIDGEPDVQFDEGSSTLVINFWLPTPENLPRIVEYRFVMSRREIKPIEMKQKDFESFYDDVVHQIGLRTTYEVLSADTSRRIKAVVFNGWVKGIDSKTGKAFTSCILSFQAPRQQFLELELRHVSPRDCIRGFKGITAGPLSMLAPVSPILDIDRADDRFVESKEILAYIGSTDNLAAMDWEDFEHLVRELFEMEFAKYGGEVRVTQASRDRGVDAIAFDPDPIRGGKFIIQAKRYNMVVPVSAVRDLFGTMISEGATKGILVTTSHFGPDSREFAKDKPITLIDGANLIHMFQKHGRDVHIAILPKGDPRRGIQG